MSTRKALLGATALLLCLAAFAPALASAAAKPAWTLTITPLPANLGGESEVLVNATNVGRAPTEGNSVVEVQLPPGVVPLKAEGRDSDVDRPFPPCSFEPVARTAKCETAEPIFPGRRLVLIAIINTTAPEGTVDLKASAKGGAATQTDLTVPAAVSSQPLPFDLLPGFAAPSNYEDGSAAVLAGSHPYQQTIDFGFPTKKVGSEITNDGHARNFHTELPRGLLGSPAATPVLCTELKLIEGNCPDDSQVGVTDVTTLLAGKGTDTVFTTNLYNMVPPPGYPAEIATNVANAGIFVHILASLRSDGDYGIEASVKDTLAFGLQPIFNVQAQIWGLPSDEVHDPIRGKCTDTANKSCPTTRTPTALLTMPGDCSGKALGFEQFADSWEEPSPPAPLRRATYESADLQGNPVSLKDCAGLKYEPTIATQLTTDLADSPTGLDFHLHQPQDTAYTSRASAGVKDATVTFPKGLAVNPAQAAGLGACSEAQIGFQGAQEGRLSFSRAPQSCPAAAKIGSLEASSPALVLHNEKHEVETDPETGEPLPEVLHGSVYVATPFANPFDSLIATYLVVEDEKTGISAKIAGEAQLDPQSGQITARFRENPELPLEDISVHLFGGNRGALISPPTCATYTTEAQLVPWSAPEGEVARRQASLEVSRGANGGACPGSEAGMPNSPSLRAGTSPPQAGAFAPLSYKLTRADGTQRFGRIETTLPTGLSARLAGVGMCSEADIAKARSREAPDQGAAELADPSCPASSRIATAIAAAGAGPSPYYTTGSAYLAGPYKGAPFSVVAIVPAIAGPFDLGTVVVRAAVYLDPETAQARVVSDPLPQILQGVPIDARQVSLDADRPGFTLNPTSCAVKSFGGQLISALGAPAPLFERFQVGGCSSLPYKPKLSARLFGPIHRGGHPRFRAVLSAKPGEANTAALSLTLPDSEFIDQAHFRTICTRVQFAADQCPAGSVYGNVKAKSPLVDYTLEGPIYLRSSSHKLPDAVAVLRGPPSQPIEIDAAARIDSVNGGLRSRVEVVPDAPIEKVVITLQGAKKGLFQNSTNICKGTHRMSVSFTGQNGKAHDIQPKLNAQCNKGKSAKGKGRH